MNEANLTDGRIVYKNSREIYQKYIAGVDKVDQGGYEAAKHVAKMHFRALGIPDWTVSTIAALALIDTANESQEVVNKARDLDQ